MPIEQLLAGSGGAAYTLPVRGDGQPTQQALLGQPWVTAVAACGSQWLVVVVRRAALAYQ